MFDRLIINILEWAAGHHDEGRYSPVAIVFHWTMAALVFVQLGLGWMMGRVAPGAGKIAAYEWHFMIGILMLVLAVGRGAWRLLAPGPINDADKPGWKTTASKITHAIFYAALLGLPLSGWAMISATAREQKLSFLGLVPWPLLPFEALSQPQRWAVEAAAEWMHWALIVSLLLLIPIHVGAALRHQFIERSDVLHGMAPIVPLPPERPTAFQRRLKAAEQAIVSKAIRPFRRSAPRSAARRRTS